MAPRKSIIPADAADDSRLSRNDYRLLIALGRHADARTGACVVRHEMLADELGLTRRSIIRLFAHLAEFGYVAIEHRSGIDGGKVASAYQLLAPARQGALFEDPHVTGVSHGDVTPGVTGDVTAGVTSVTTLSERKNSLSQRGRAHARRKKDERPTVDDGQRELIPVVALVAAKEPDAMPPRRGAEAPPLRFSAIDGARARPSASGAPALIPAGTRIPPDWRPTPADLAWAAKHGLAGVALETELTRFGLHWRQRAGPDALKADWSAAWQSWVLTWVRFEARRAEEAGDGERGSGNGRAGGAVGDRGPRRHSEAERLGDAFAAFRRR
jgi:hypothetical protein